MEFENNIPIYIQVINQIKKDIITGKLPMGCETAIHKRTGGFISHQSEYGGEGL